MESIFGLRLRQYAVSLDRMKAAIERTQDFDEEFSPSLYTPCRLDCRENLDKLHANITGYGYAVDDMYGLSHRRTETLFYQAYENGVHKVPPYGAPEQDSGYTSLVSEKAESDADERFTTAITA